VRTREGSRNLPPESESPKKAKDTEQSSRSALSRNAADRALNRVRAWSARADGTDLQFSDATAAESVAQPAPSQSIKTEQTQRIPQGLLEKPAADAATPDAQSPQPASANQPGSAGASAADQPVSMASLLLRHCDTDKAGDTDNTRSSDNNTDSRPQQVAPVAERTESVSNASGAVATQAAISVAEVDQPKPSRSRETAARPQVDRVSEVKAPDYAPTADTATDRSRPAVPADRRATDNISAETGFVAAPTTEAPAVAARAEVAKEAKSDPRKATPNYPPPPRTGASYRALRRPRKSCGTPDQQFIQRSSYESRRALAWDDLKFRYGLLPTVRDLSSGSAAQHGMRIPKTAQLRRPRSASRHNAPSYVSELAQLDTDPAIGSSHNNPFQIGQLELPLPDMQVPLRERKIVEATRLSQKRKSTTASSRTRVPRSRSAAWLRRQTMLRRTSLAMIFTAIVITGFLLFQQPSVEVTNIPPAVSSERSAVDGSEEKGSDSPGIATEQIEADEQKSSTPPTTVPDGPPEVRVSDINALAFASEQGQEIGVVQLEDQIARVPRYESTEGPQSTNVPQRKAASLSDIHALTEAVLEMNEIMLDRHATRSSFQAVAKVSIAGKPQTEFPVPAAWSTASSAPVRMVDPVDLVNRTLMTNLDSSRNAVRRVSAQRSWFDGGLRARSTVKDKSRRLELDATPEPRRKAVDTSPSMALVNRTLDSRVIAYLGVADTLGRNAVSFMSNPLSTDRRPLPFLTTFDLRPIDLFRVEIRNSQVESELDDVPGLAATTTGEVSDGVIGRPAILETRMSRINEIIADNVFEFTRP